MHAWRLVQEVVTCCVSQGTNPQVWHYGYSNSWYLNASVDKFRNWQMRQWVAQELPEVLRDFFPQLNTRVVRS